MVTAEFEPTVALYYRASRQIAMSNRWRAFAYWSLAVCGGLIVLLAGLIALPGIGGWSDASTLFFVGVFVLAVQFVVTPLLQRWAIWRTLRGSTTARSIQHYEVGPEGFRDFGDGFSVELTWGKVRGVRLSKDFLLFFISPRVAYYIPKSLLTAAQIDQVLEWAAR